MNTTAQGKLSESSPSPLVPAISHLQVGTRSNLDSLNVCREKNQNLKPNGGHPAEEAVDLCVFPGQICSSSGRTTARDPLFPWLIWRNGACEDQGEHQAVEQQEPVFPPYTAASLISYNAICHQ